MPLVASIMHLRLAVADIMAAAEAVGCMLPADTANAVFGLLGEKGKMEVCEPVGVMMPLSLLSQRTRVFTARLRLPWCLRSLFSSAAEADADVAEAADELRAGWLMLIGCEERRAVCCGDSGALALALALK